LHNFPFKYLVLFVDLFTRNQLGVIEAGIN